MFKLRSVFQRFRKWLKRDVLEIRILDRERGLISESEMISFSMDGVVFAEDDQEFRTIQRRGSNSYGLTVNLTFLSLICPHEEKRTVQKLIKETSTGQYVLIVRGVDPHE